MPISRRRGPNYIMRKDEREDTTTTLVVVQFLFGILLTFSRFIDQVEPGPMIYSFLWILRTALYFSTLYWPGTRRYPGLFQLSQEYLVKLWQIKRSSVFPRNLFLCIASFGLLFCILWWSIPAREKTFIWTEGNTRSLYFARGTLAAAGLAHRGFAILQGKYIT